MAGATLAIGLALSGCGTSTVAAPLAPTVAPAQAENTAVVEATAAATSARSSRGNLIKEVGIASSSSIDGEQIVNFVVTSIEVDPGCSVGYMGTAENGYFVVVSIDAETTPALAKEPYPAYSLSSANWKIIADNGTTQNQSAATPAASICVSQAERFPQTLGPDEKATGKIVLDVVSASGTLVLLSGSGSGSGWEWEYAAK